MILRIASCFFGLTPVERRDHRIGFPLPGRWAEVMNTDAAVYGGSGMGNGGTITAADDGYARVTLPPLSTLMIEAA